MSPTNPLQGQPEVLSDPVDGRLSDEQVHHQGSKDRNEDNLFPPVP
jgi:hypothetical protein